MATDLAAAQSLSLLAGTVNHFGPRLPTSLARRHRPPSLCHLRPSHRCLNPRHGAQSGAPRLPHVMAQPCHVTPVSRIQAPGEYSLGNPTALSPADVAATQRPQRLGTLPAPSQHGAQLRQPLQRPWSSLAASTPTAARAQRARGRAAAICAIPDGHGGRWLDPVVLGLSIQPLDLWPLVATCCGSVLLHLALLHLAPGAESPRASVDPRPLRRAMLGSARPAAGHTSAAPAACGDRGAPFPGSSHSFGVRGTP